MSQTGEERVQAFRDAVNASPELQAKVTAEDADWVEIAQAAGHEITAEEVQAYMTAHENDELSEFELEAVAGGASNWRRRARMNKGRLQSAQATRFQESL